MSSRLIFMLNDPNLNLLGKRQPHIYGQETLVDVERECRGVAAEPGLEIRFHQSHREYGIIDWAHKAREVAGGIVISFVSARADGVIAGFGTQGHTLALRRVATLLESGA